MPSRDKVHHPREVRLACQLGLRSPRPVAANRTPDNWINPAAFEKAAPYTIGNALRESATKNFDGAFAKTCKASERFNLQFRAEFLNMSNTLVFGGGFNWWPNIQACIECGMFGQVIGTRNSPRNVQFALRLQY